MKTQTEQLTEVVERVRVATETLGGDDSKLRAIAFQKLLDHELSQGKTDVHLNSSPQELGSDPAALIDDVFATPTMREQAIADYFRIESNRVQDLFDIAHALPQLKVRVDLWDHSDQIAAREIALLVCGARTALGIETGTADIRKAAEIQGRTDANLINHLLCMDEIVVRGKSTSSNRLVRMRATGAECVRGIAQRLVSNGQ